MILLELVCLAIVATYAVARLVRAGSAAERAGFVARFAALATASFAGEDTVIRAYGYYAYAPGWSVRLDQVPLVIVLVWPVVIDSAATLARAIVGGAGVGLGSGRGRVLRIALLGSAVVLADASLIEPIAVRAGLWHWTEPGLFAVPLVGIAGWAFFSFAAIAILESSPVVRRGSTLAALLVIAPVATHLTILATWWMFFRWVQGERSGVVAAAVAWAASAVIAVAILRSREPRRVPASELLLRLPGAAFFFALLLVGPAPPPALLLYAVAFAPPYLVALARIATAKEAPAPSAAPSIPG